MMKIVDLFCGCGGFTEGFKSAEFNILAGVDKDADAIKTYEANHDSDAYQLDLSEITPRDLCEHIGVQKNEIDGIIGGPPCQGFSQAGDRNPSDPRNKLVRNYFSIIEFVEPKFFVMENVPAITYSRNKEAISYIQQKSDKMGYNLSYKTINVADFGVPQTRKRTFFLGYKNTEPEFPNPTHESNRVGMNDVIDVPDGQIVSSYGTTETLKGERNTRHTSKPSYTVRATRCLVDIIPSDYEPPEDGSTPSITDVRIYRTDESESALIQSFPKDFEFVGNKTSKQSQIGNAVPPKMATAIADKVKDTLN